MKYIVAVSLFLLSFSQSFAQQKTFAAGPVKYMDLELKVGDHHIFDFSKTSDGSAPFGGKQYKVEFESRDTSEITTAWRGKIEVDEGGKIVLRDQAIFFAGSDSPEYSTLRVIVDNATVFRCNIKVPKKPVPPVPSPYLKVIAEAFAVDKGRKAQAVEHANVFRDVNSSLLTYKLGSDVWKAIEVKYAAITPLLATRNVIAKILFDVSRQYYDSVLTSPDRQVLSRMLKEIQEALSSCDEDSAPPVPPVPVGPVKLWLIAVEETEQAAASRGSWFTSSDLANRIKEKGHKWRIIEKDAKGPDKLTPADMKPYIDNALGKDPRYPAINLPALFLVDQTTGKVYFRGESPKTVANLLQLLTSMGG